MGGCMSRKTGTFDPMKDLPDLTGRVVLVTGGNTGIGYHTVKFLARKGAKVYLGARDESKAAGAIAEMEYEGLGPGFGQVVWLNVNFSDPRSAKAAAEEFVKREERLDILINNAAQLTGAYEKTKDGLSNVFVVNHFSPFVFTRTLLPLLIKTSKEPDSDVRIVTLSSILHGQSRAANPDIKFQGLEDFNAEFAEDFWPDMARYSVTKLANLLFARQLQKRLDAEHIPILSIPIHPGEVNTWANRTPWPVVSNIVMGIFFMLPEAGSYNSLFAAVSPLVREKQDKYKNAYLEPPVGKVGEMSVHARRDDLAEELWYTTEMILKDMGV